MKTGDEEIERRFTAVDLVEHGCAHLTLEFGGGRGPSVPASGATPPYLCGRKLLCDEVGRAQVSRLLTENGLVDVIGPSCPAAPTLAWHLCPLRQTARVGTGLRVTADHDPSFGAPHLVH